jgi:hypothetical protein
VFGGIGVVSCDSLFLGMTTVVVSCGVRDVIPRFSE